MQSDHSERGVWLFFLELSCKQSYGFPVEHHLIIINYWKKKQVTNVHA